MKRLISVTLILMLAFGLAACGANSETAQGGKQTDVFGWNVRTSGTDESSSSIGDPSSDGLSSSEASAESSESAASAESSAELPASAESSQSAQSPSEASQASSEIPDNYYTNNDSSIEDGKVALKLRSASWSNGKLSVECFIINGNDVPVSEIEVTELTISNADGTVASASFGEIGGLTIQPKTYVVWAFTFSGSMIKAPGADIRSLGYSSNVAYAYEG